MKRIHVYYSGTVQGVGFRYTTARVAADYNISGYVRNMRDGRVEIVIEGQEDETKSFLQKVADRMRGYIRDSQVVEEPYAKEFNDFDIRF